MDDSLYPARETPLTFAESGDENPGSLFLGAAARQVYYSDNLWAHHNAFEEAYDRRIKQIKGVTGIDLDNPERIGAALGAAQTAAGVGGAVSSQIIAKRQDFEKELDELRRKHPDKIESLAFGDISKEAAAIARGAEDEYERAKNLPNLGGLTEFGAGVVGGMWGQRRDPLFIGSLFAGPTGAMGRTVAGRIAMSALTQGAYNAGLAVLEQPAVQAWRQQVGLRSGWGVGVENVGMAALAGLIPGAVLRGGYEAFKGVQPALQRLLGGEARPGDIESVMQVARDALREIDRTNAERIEPRAIGQALAADESERAAGPPPTPELNPETSDRLMGSALKHADDPIGQPSPEAVAATLRVQPVPDMFAPPSPFKLASSGELSAERAGQVAKQLKQNQGEIEDRIFGSKEVADRWRKLNRQSNRAWDNAKDAEAREFDRQIGDLEEQANLSGADEAYLNGEGWPEFSDPDAWRDLARNLRDFEVDREDRVAALGRVLRRLPNENKPVSAHDHWTLAEIQHALSEEAKQGGNAQELLRDAFRSSRDAYGGGSDAAEIVQSDMERLRRLLENEPKPPPALPPARPREPEPGEAEIANAIAEASPENEHEAQLAVDEMLEHEGRKVGMDVNRRLEADAAAQRKANAGTIAEEPKPAKGDPLGHIPWADERGKPTTITAASARQIDRNELKLAELVKACK
jgi:hypothetical protein